MSNFSFACIAVGMSCFLGGGEVFFRGREGGVKDFFHGEEEWPDHLFNGENSSIGSLGPREREGESGAPPPPI